MPELDPSADESRPIKLFPYLLTGFYLTLLIGTIVPSHSSDGGVPGVMFRGMLWLQMAGLGLAVFARWTDKRHYWRLAWCLMWTSPLLPYLMFGFLRKLPLQTVRHLLDYVPG